jgi:hypothetical protein
MCSSGGVGVLLLYAMFLCFSRLGRYVYRDHQDLTVWDLKHFSRIVQGDGRTGDLKRETVRRQHTVDLAAMRCEERSAKLLMHTALASCVFGVLVGGARVVEVTPAVPTMWGLGSIFDLDLTLHVARRYVSCIPQAKRHAGWRSRGCARALDAFADLNHVREHAFDAIKPRDQVARSGLVGFCQQICFDLLVRSDRVPSMTRQVAGAVDSNGIEPKQMSTGLRRMSVMLSGKMTLLVEVIKHRVARRTLDSSPTWHANCQMFRTRQPTWGSTLVV